MKKTFLLLVLLFSTSMLFGAYDIQLGVFKNIKNLRVNISKVKPYTFRKQIIVRKKNKLYYTHAIIEGSTRQATKALHAYKRVFSDAFIIGKTKQHAKIRSKKKRVKKKITKVNEPKKFEKIAKIENAVKVQKVTNSIPLVNMPIIGISESNSSDKNLTTTVKLLDISSTKKDNNTTIKIAIIEKKEPVDAKILLGGKSIYFCYENGPEHLKYRVVQMIFNEKLVTYMPVDTESMLEFPYVIEKEKVMLSLFDTQVVHKVVKNKSAYLLVESYVDDKYMYTLRYYFDKSLALKYVKRD